MAVEFAFKSFACIESAQWSVRKIKYLVGMNQLNASSFHISFACPLSSHTGTEVFDAAAANVPADTDPEAACNPEVDAEVHSSAAKMAVGLGFGKFASFEGKRPR
jgi:hypothetical protein